MNVRKPFCFRCRGEPKYQLELNKKDWRGPFWPLCAKCILEIPWERVIRATVEGIEEADEQDARDREPA